jgi:hypothetical protein
MEAKESVWALIETHYEYDDNTYSESGVHPPVRVYRNRDRAIQEMITATFEYIVENDIDRWGCDIDDFVTPEGIEMLKEYLPIIEVCNDEDININTTEGVCRALQHVIKTVNEADRTRLFDCLRLKPYGISEVSIE